MLSRNNPLFNFVSPFLKLDISDFANLLVLLSKRIHYASPGLYEVLDHDITLDLKDTKGNSAIYHKRQKVRFLQDSIVAYLDKAWGDGDIFADYLCSPGTAVDCFREGHRYNILISLRQTKNRGEVEEFHIERRIDGGFTHPTEEFQTEIDHRTQAMSMTVTLPRSRPLRKVYLIQQNTGQSIPLGVGYITTLPDGRQQIRWATKRVRLYEAYILRWTW